MATAIGLAAYHGRERPPITAGDYAHYLLHAKALVENRPYSETGYIFTSANPHIGPVTLPPGVPLVIAPIVALDGVNSPWLRVAMVGTLCAFLLLAWKALARRGDPLLASAAILITAAAIESSRATVVVGSDLGFAALIWALVVLTDADTPWSRGRIVAITLVGFVAMSFRMAGAVVVPAMILFAFLQTRKERLRILLPVTAWLSVALGLFFAGKLQIPVAFTYELTDASVLLDLSDKLTTYRRAVFESILYPFPWPTGNDVYHVVGSLLVLVGAVRFMKRHRRDIVLALCVAYAAMLAAVTVDAERYLWPFFPVAALALLEGTDAVLSRAGAFPGARIRLVAAAGIAITLVAIGRHVTMPVPPTLLDNGDALAVFAEIRREGAQSPARAVFMNPRVLTLETGVPAMGFPRLHPRPLLRELDVKRITHVVEGELGTSAELNARLTETISMFPDRFMLIHRNASFRLYRVRPPDGGPG